MKPRYFPLALAFVFCLQSGVFSSRAHVAVDEMAAAAEKFLTSLDADQKAKATFEFKADERLNWHFIPKARKGLPIGEMKPSQRQLAHGLLRSALSDHGYNKMTNIMSLELILKELESANPRMVRDPELYYFSIFGQPTAKGTWGWRAEGHHFSANFTIVNGELMSGTPSFLGANPAEVREGPRKGLRILGAEEDIARQLVKMLSEEQRRTAILPGKAPGDIITAAERKVKALEPVGLARSAMNEKQGELLTKLIREYVYHYRPEIADQDLNEIKQAGMEKVTFAWAGEMELGAPHYYRVQGPTFLLEYDNTQNNANHVHAVWRDFKNDFGEDLLRQHYDKIPHP